MLTRFLWQVLPVLLTRPPLISVLLAGAVASCASTTEPSIPLTELSQPFSAENYAVRPTDTLRIDVYREPDLSTKYVVDPSGTINFPLVGRVAVMGENVKQIENRLRSLLAGGYLVDPDVRVSVVAFQPIFVSGEVRSPGKYPFQPGMTVQQALLLAGDTTRFASDRYYLQRNNAPTSQRVRVDGNSVLFPGDVITVGERLF